ncbi:hypothetical protein [Paenibacillus bovis]|uniref:CdiA C-terminal domain-containing protein n=1 Tax=Paenibacillus bovis TaxID=1616788 RepID=UPI0007618FD1|nr:hypothetical protein [Paenibacillus bovis]
MPARRSCGGGSSRGKGSLLASIASSVWQGIVRQYEHDQEQRTDYDHWILGKVFTSARNLITSSNSLDFVKTLWNESLSFTNSYQQVPEKIRKQWNKEYTERELKRLGEMDIKDLTLAEVLQLNPGGWKFFDKEAEGYYITQNYYTLWMYGSNAYKRLDNAMYGSGYFLPKLEEMCKQGKDLSQLTVAEMDEMSQSEGLKLERISLLTTLALDFTGSRSISSGFSEHLPTGKGTGKTTAKTSGHAIPEKNVRFNQTPNINSTVPSLSKGGKPKGNYAPPNGGRGNVRQNEAADLLAEKGYDIHMLDEIDGGNGYGLKINKNPDFLIENKVFDCYAPEAKTSFDSITGNIKEKTKNQAKHIVLNLDDYPSENIDDLLKEIVRQTNPKANLKHLDELIIVKNGEVYTAYGR